MMMKYSIPRSMAVTAIMASVAWIVPASSDTPPGPLVTPIIVDGKPSAADVTELCKLDGPEIGEVSGSVPYAATTFTENETLFTDVILKVAITKDSDSFSFSDVSENSSYGTDPSAPDQRAGTPGVEAVVVIAEIPSEEETATYLSNVYCYFNAESDTGLVAPGEEEATEIAVYWSSGPCLLPTQAAIEMACEAYNGLPGNPAKQSAHYLQKHLVAPTEPVNVCGCPFDAGNGVEQRIATFCNHLLAPGEPGACPTGTGPDIELTGVSSQATATSGTSTCQRVVIGGRAFFIGDTCF